MVDLLVQVVREAGMIEEHEGAVTVDQPDFLFAGEVDDGRAQGAAMFDAAIPDCCDAVVDAAQGCGVGLFRWQNDQGSVWGWPHIGNMVKDCEIGKCFELGIYSGNDIVSCAERVGKGAGVAFGVPGEADDGDVSGGQKVGDVLFGADGGLSWRFHGSLIRKNGSETKWGLFE